MKDKVFHFFPKISNNVDLQMFNVFLMLQNGNKKNHFKELI